MSPNDVFLIVFGRQWQFMSQRNKLILLWLHRLVRRINPLLVFSWDLLTLWKIFPDLSFQRKQEATLYSLNNTFYWHLGLTWGPACMAVPRNEWFRCWVMSSFILTLCNHSLLTAVREMNKCTAVFWLFSRVFSSYFIHTLINSAEGGR